MLLSNVHCDLPEYYQVFDHKAVYEEWPPEDAFSDEEREDLYMWNVELGAALFTTSEIMKARSDSDDFPF